jgi:hypothetical protein
VTLVRPVPFWDQFVSIGEFIALSRNETRFVDLFGQHNEHRIFTYRPHFLVDAFVFRMANTSLIITIYTIQLLLAFAFTWLIAHRRGSWLYMAATCLVILGGTWALAQHENLRWGFQVSFVYVHLFAVLSLSCLGYAFLTNGPRAKVLFAAASAFDFLCIYSTAAGLLLIIPAVACAVWLRARFTAIMLFCLLHLCYCGLYFLGYLNLRSAGNFDLWQLLEFVAGFLAFPVSPFTTPAYSTFFGIAALVVFLVLSSRLFWNALIHKRQVPLQTAVLLSVCTFAVCEALLIATGRAHFSTPDSSRYATPAILFWLALLGLGWRATCRSVPSQSALAARGLTLMLSLVFLLCANSPSYRTAWLDYVGLLDRAGFAAASGVRSGPAIASLYADPNLVRLSLDFLKQHQLSLFSPSQTRYTVPSDALPSTHGVELPICRGNLDIVQRSGDHDLTVAGWLISPTRTSSPRWIGLYQGAALRGYVRSNMSRDDVAWALASSTPFLGFMVAGRVFDKSGEVSLIATFEHGPACRYLIPDNRSLSRS